MTTPTEELDRDLRRIRAGLRQAGVSDPLLRSVETRALRTGRRQTGPWPTNREARWRLDPAHPQYGSEADCKTILLRLLGMMLEFRNAPSVDDATRETLEAYLGHPIQAGSYRDPLTLERLDYAELRLETESPEHGRSEFHLGHRNPQAIPRHVPGNVEWRSARSNLIQGDLTLREARQRFVELIARYFELGEVTIEPEEDAST
jgi:hypothetical protein